MNATVLSRRFCKIAGLLLAAHCVAGSASPALGQCTTDADCEDFNPCTVDDCFVLAGACNNTPMPAGTSCGSIVDDHCTDPDTCDGNGQCLTNNASNGTVCTREGFGAGTCTGGLCAPVQLAVTLLPDSGFIASQAYDFAFMEGDPDRPLVVGSVTRPDTTTRAAAWHSSDGGQSFTLTVLPTEPPDQPAVASAVACNSSGQCFAGGGAGNVPNRLPTVWRVDPLPAQLTDPVPLPQGCGSAKIGDLAPVEGGVYFACAGEARCTFGKTTTVKAVLWELDSNGVLIPPIELPDSGPGTNSKGSGIATDPLDGRIVVAGATQEPGGDDGLPTIWLETAPGSWEFNMIVLPTVASVRIVFADDDVIETQLKSRLNGDGTIRSRVEMDLEDVEPPITIRVGATYESSDYQNWDYLVLPPLPSHENSSAVFGSSYPSGGQPRSSGTGTYWDFDFDIVPPRINAGPTDVNEFLIPDDALNMILTSTVLQGELRTSLLDEPTTGIGTLLPASPGGSGQADGSAAAGPPMPHAGFIKGQLPQALDIPAVSSWGLVIVTLLLATAGTAVLIRRPCATPPK